MNKKMKPKIVMVGICPNCGAEVTRNYPIDAGVCTCKNPDVALVPLKPAVVLSNREYGKFEKIAELSGVTVTQLVNGLLKEAAEQKLRDLKLLPEVTVTVSKYGG
jgi:hypothetical protein